MSGTARLEAALGYRFVDRELLDQALIHRSFTAEHPRSGDNERLEFLGDAVLQLAVTSRLYRAHPDLSEGQLAKVRAAVVDEPTLAAAARRLDLGRHLRLGKGEEASGGRDKDSILSDAFEAVLGAMYLDAGYEMTAEVVLAHFRQAIDDRAEEPGKRDFKTRLQELLALEGVRPEYESWGEGPDHDKVFTSVVSVEGRSVARGRGGSKKAAEQEAARRALATLETGVGGRWENGNAL